MTFIKEFGIRNKFFLNCAENKRNLYAAVTFSFAPKYKFMIILSASLEAFALLLI